MRYPVDPMRCAYQMVCRATPGATMEEKPYCWPHFFQVAMNRGDFTMDSEVIFSPDKKYRYSLIRTWKPGSRILWIMLNPSTADENKNDPTITRCIARSMNLGHGSIQVVNLFAFKSTDPEALRKIKDPIGKENDLYIYRAIERADSIVLAWGSQIKNMVNKRRPVILHYLNEAEKIAYCLGKNKSGHPCHPLYISYEKGLERFDANHG